SSGCLQAGLDELGVSQSVERVVANRERADCSGIGKGVLGFEPAVAGQLDDPVAGQYIHGFVCDLDLYGIGKRVSWFGNIADPKLNPFAPAKLDHLAVLDQDVDAAVDRQVNAALNAGAVLDVRFSG